MVPTDIPTEQLSLAERLALLGTETVKAEFAKFTPFEKAALEYRWSFWERPGQRPPIDDFFIWLLLPGRGFGKTRIGAEHVIQWATVPETRIALGGKEPDDYVGVMVEGESGILRRSPPWNRPKWNRSSSPPQLTWANGSKAFCYSGETPEALRGPAHHKCWIDELAKFKYPDKFFDNLLFGMRLGEKPQIVITTTPQPIKLIKELVAQSKIPGSGVVLTSGSTYENLKYLAPHFQKMVLKKYEGTRLGRQEIYGELLTDTPGALWTLDTLEANRRHTLPALERVVVAVDPSANDGNEENLDEAGIICAGLGNDQHGYCLDDKTLHGSPIAWAKEAIALYFKHQADLIVAEGNNGGEMVRTTILSVNPNVPVKIVTASRAKYTRAEPISALDEQGRLHLVGHFKDLEDELTTWVPGLKSPNRLDAYVWAFTELMQLYTPFEISTVKPEEDMAQNIEQVQYKDQKIDPAVKASLLNMGL